jgi:hypothetical protein
MVKDTQSIRIEPDLWKEVKKRAIDLDMSISEYVENLIKKDLKKKE